MVWKHVFSHVNTLSVPYIWGGDRFPALHLGGRWCCETAECTELKSESEEVLKRKYVWYQVTEEDKILQDQYFGLFWFISRFRFEKLNGMIKANKAYEQIVADFCIFQQVLWDLRTMQRPLWGRKGTRLENARCKSFTAPSTSKCYTTRYAHCAKRNVFLNPEKKIKETCGPLGIEFWSTCSNGVNLVSTLSCYMLLHSYIYIRHSKWTHCFSMFSLLVQIQYVQWLF